MPWFDRLIVWLGYASPLIAWIAFFAGARLVKATLKPWVEDGLYLLITLWPLTLFMALLIGALNHFSISHWAKQYLGDAEQAKQYATAALDMTDQLAVELRHQLATLQQLTSKVNPSDLMTLLNRGEEVLERQAQLQAEWRLVNSPTERQLLLELVAYLKAQPHSPTEDISQSDQRDRGFE